MTEADVSATSPVAGASGGSRWAAGVAMGVLLAIPLGFLLSYLSFLPAMLGLFFFLLFGLLIGAAMFRFWAPLRPMPQRSIIWGVAAAGLCGWGGALMWEAAIFPRQAANEAIRQVPKEVPGKTPADIRTEASLAARQFLRERYPPGGVLGYFHWAVTGKYVEIPIVGVSRPKPIRLGNTGWLFIVRVLLSGIALSAAILAMVKPLSKPAPAPESAHATGPATASVGRTDDGYRGNGHH